MQTWRPHSFFGTGAILKWSIVLLSFLIALAAFYSPLMIATPDPQALAASAAQANFSPQHPAGRPDRPTRSLRDRSAKPSNYAVGATGIRG